MLPKRPGLLQSGAFCIFSLRTLFFDFVKQRADFLKSMYCNIKILLFVRVKKVFMKVFVYRPDIIVETILP